MEQSLCLLEQQGFSSQTGAGGRTAHAATSGLPSTSGLAKQRRLQKTDRDSNTGEQNSSTFVTAGIVKWEMFLWTFPAFASLQLRKVKCPLSPCEGTTSPGPHSGAGDGVSCALCCPWCDLMVSSLSDIQELPQKCCPGGAPGCSQPHLLLRAPGKVNNGFALPHPEHLIQLCIVPSLVPWECHWLPHRPRDPTPPRSCSHPSHSPIPDHLTRCLWLWEGTETAPVQTSLHFCCSGSSVLNSTASRHEVPKQHQGDV